jgi:hypothetical protein
MPMAVAAGVMAGSVRGTSRADRHVHEQILSSCPLPSTLHAIAPTYSSTGQGLSSIRDDATRRSRRTGSNATRKTSSASPVRPADARRPLGWSLQPLLRTQPGSRTQATRRVHQARPLLVARRSSPTSCPAWRAARLRAWRSSTRGQVRLVPIVPRRTRVRPLRARTTQVIAQRLMVAGLEPRTLPAEPVCNRV